MHCQLTMEIIYLKVVVEQGKRLFYCLEQLSWRVYIHNIDLLYSYLQKNYTIN